MAERTSSLTPSFTWSDEAHRYRDLSTGRYVKPDALRGALNAVIDASKSSMAGLSEQLRGGTISLADWQRGVAAEIKVLHVASAASARGGWAHMSPADYGYSGQLIRQQYQYLRGFAGDIASGKQPLDGRFLRRAEMYAEAARATESEMERRLARQSGRTEEINRLGAADHCDGCLSASSRGWVPIGTLPRVGARNCLTRCRCWIETRISTKVQAA